MADEELNYTRVTITNNAPGPRIVHGREGPVTIYPGQTSQPFHVNDADLKDAKGNNDFDVKTGKAAKETAPGGGEDDKAGGEAGDKGPADLTDDNSRDGYKSKDALLEIAKAEKVEIEGGDTKAQIVAKIVAARKAATEKALAAAAEKAAGGGDQ